MTRGNQSLSTRPKMAAARRTAVLVVAVLVLLGGASRAQQTGNLHGTVSDESGGPLQGVAVTLEGMGAPRVMLTDEAGQYRFLSLDPGTYQLSAALDGFSMMEQPRAVVGLNRNTIIDFILPSAVEEMITVTSESPLLDSRKLTAGITVNRVEMDKIPTARDPWSLLPQTPGVLVDRINVGGSESGKQPLFTGLGSPRFDNDFLLDGVQVNDTWGLSDIYYDFDQFAEISLTTGGTDITKHTAGVEVNMVTKRGTNEFRGSARFFVTDAEGYFGGALRQSQPDLESELCRTGCPTEQTDIVGARTERIEDIGFEAGGAAVRDRVWLWGSWGQNDIQTVAASGAPEDTLLENTAIKLNAQLSAANSGLVSYNNSDKVIVGSGAGPTRSPESLWDERGPSAIYRFEDTHIFSSSLFVTGTYAISDLGFQLMARGPDEFEDGLAPGAPDPYYDPDGVWQENYLSGGYRNPADEFKIDASYFFSSGSGVHHELKAGGRLRTMEVTSLFSWGPRNVFQTFWGSTVARHSQAGPTTNEYLSLWAQDTITVGNLTINAGLRYDEQTGYTEPAAIEAHAVFPETLPALEVGRSENVSVPSLTPRLGLTYAMGEERQTLLRASFSQFTSQLRLHYGNFTSPTYYGWYAYFYGGELYAAVFFDPLNPTVSPNAYGSDLNEITSELIAGVEHAVLPELVVGGTVTWRETTDVLDFIPNVRDGTGGIRPATVDDFVQVATQTGTIPRSGEVYSVPVFDLACGNLFDPSDGCPTGGSTMGSGGREREYLGASLTFTKRLANRWMARGFLNYGDAEWKVPPDQLGGRSPYGGSCLNNPSSGGCRDGDLYGQGSTGSGRGWRLVQATWSFNLNGMVQVAPNRSWGFNVSTSVSGREGHPIPYFSQVGLSTGGLSQSVVDDLDRFRLHDPITVDLRLEKEFAVQGPINLTFGIDLFNALNDNTGLSYNPNTGISRAGWLEDNVSPRVYRLGVRLNWR